jgi:hypothetical protein
MKGYKNISSDILLFYLKSETIQQEEGRPLETLFFYTLNSTIFFNSKMISPNCHMPLPYAPCPTPLALCHSPYAVRCTLYAVRHTPLHTLHRGKGKDGIAQRSVGGSGKDGVKGTEVQDLLPLPGLFENNIFIYLLTILIHIFIYSFIQF